MAGGLGRHASAAPASSLLRRKGHLGSLRLALPQDPSSRRCAADNVSGLRMLLQHQAEVNATDHTGRTARLMAGG